MSSSSYSQWKADGFAGEHRFELLGHHVVLTASRNDYARYTAEARESEGAPLPLSPVEFLALLDAAAIGQAAALNTIAIALAAKQADPSARIMGTRHGDDLRQPFVDPDLRPAPSPWKGEGESGRRQRARPRLHTR